LHQLAKPADAALDLAPDNADILGPGRERFSLPIAFVIAKRRSPHS
jgi:hypothetical protein